MDTLFEILQLIHKYYPVGIPYGQKAYPGYVAALSIVDEKGDDSKRDRITEPWNLLVKLLHDKYNDKEISDATNLPFPSFSLSIFIDKKNELFIERRTVVNLFISLLGPYYTVYLEDTFIHHSNIKGPHIEAARLYRVEMTEEETGIIDTVKKLVSESYSEHKLIPYKPLQFKIQGAIPIGFDTDSQVTEYTIFNFLFGSD